MSTYNNFTTSISLADFTAENWEALVRNGVNPKQSQFDKAEIRMLQNAHQGTTHTLKNYIDQVLNGAINHYNNALVTAYNRIAHLEAQISQLQGELIRLPEGNVASKAKVPEPPTFAGSENKMYLHDWLSQIALYCLASGIVTDSQKIVCALTRLRAPTSTYMKSYMTRFRQEWMLVLRATLPKNLKIFTDKEMTRRELRRN